MATIPAVVIGFAVREGAAAGLRLPELAAVFLIVNGACSTSPTISPPARARPLAELSTWLDAVIIGLWQCLALVPGLSRSGRDHGRRLYARPRSRGRGAFLLPHRHPIILGAVGLEAPKLIRHAHVGGLAVLAGVVAGVTAFISTALLMRWFRGREGGGFTPFAVYCVVAGMLALAWLYFTTR